MLQIGTVLVIITGFRHVILCGNAAVVAVTYHRHPNPISEPFTNCKNDNHIYGGGGMGEDSATEDATRARVKEGEWTPSLVLTLHPGSVVSCGCILTHSCEMEFLFTTDRQNNVAVTILDKGKCIKSSVNEAFVHAQITAMSAIDSKLYLALADGCVVVLNVDRLIHGDIELSSMLSRLVQSHESLFTSSAGISSMIVVSPNGFLGLRDEDECKRDEQKAR